MAVTVHLAPEDPRLFDLERGVLGKMRRVIPNFTVRYAGQTRSGLFERGGEYGEIWYQVGPRRAIPDPDVDQRQDGPIPERERVRERC